MKPFPSELNVRFGRFVVEAKGSEAIRCIKAPLGILYHRGCSSSLRNRVELRGFSSHPNWCVVNPYPRLLLFSTACLGEDTDG